MLENRHARVWAPPALLVCALTGLMALLILLAPGPAPAAARAGHPRHVGHHRHARHHRHRRVHRQRRAHIAVVNGTTTAISAVPWTTYVTVVEPGVESWACDGAIIDSTHVLTAAHCVYDDNGALAPAADFTVQAGLSNYTDAGGQSDTVSVADPNPGYDPAASADPYDVAILTLVNPLDLSGPDVQAIPLATSAPAPGSTVSVAGFGIEIYGYSPDGNLYSINQTTYALGECVYDYDAIMGCASNPSGATCNGDSGSAITQGGRLVGILDEGGSQCAPGDPTLYAKTTTPELADFIAGTANPPVAPQGGDDIACQAPSPVQVGDTVTCTPGTWNGSPSFGYEFVDDSTGAVLGQGSTDYTVQAGDVGRQIDFLASATNSGGTGWERFASVGPIQAAPALQPIVPIVAPAPAPAPKPVTSVGRPAGSATTTTGPLTETVRGPGGSVLRSTATVRRVRPGASFQVHAVLSAGGRALHRMRVCIAFSGPARVTRAARHGRRRGRSECWTVSVRAHRSTSLWLTLRVAARVRRGSSLTLTTSTGRARTHARVGIR